jgi:hypothetical protein
LVKRGSEERRVRGGMGLVGDGRWWAYGPLCRFPGILRVFVCAMWVCGVCGPPVSWRVCVCVVGGGVLGGVDVVRWLSGVPALVEGVGVGRWRPGVPALERRPGRNSKRGWLIRIKSLTFAKYKALLRSAKVAKSRRLNEAEWARSKAIQRSHPRGTPE